MKTKPGYTGVTIQKPPGISASAAAIFCAPEKCARSNRKSHFPPVALWRIAGRYSRNGWIGYWQALAAGSSVLVAEDGQIIEVFPDGSRKVIKQIAKPIRINFCLDK